MRFLIEARLRGRVTVYDAGTTLVEARGEALYLSATHPGASLVILQFTIHGKEIVEPVQFGADDILAEFLGGELLS